MSIWDSVPNPNKATSNPPKPKVTGGLWSDISNTPTVPKVPVPVAPKVLTKQPFAAVDEVGNSFGFSDTEKDASGRPFFAYRKPGDTSTTTDKTRVATEFDPRKAQPVTRDDFYNPRAVENRAALKKALGGTYSDELDHRIALALSGSNDVANLKNIPADDNQEAGQLEQKYQQKVIKGEMSLFDAQVAMAKEKGFDAPFTGKQKKKLTDYLKAAATKVYDTFSPAVEPALDVAVPLAKDAPKQFKKGSSLWDGIEEGLLQTSSNIQRFNQVFYDTIGNKQLAGEMKKGADQDKEFFTALASQGVPVNDERKFSEKLSDPKWFYRSLGQNIPNLLASIGAGIATGGAGPVAAGIAAGTTGGAIQFGSSYDEAVEKVGESKAKKIAAVTGLGNAVLEALPGFRLFSKFAKKEAVELIKDTFLKKVFNRLTSIATQGSLEGGTEAVQTVYENAIKQTYDENQELFAGVPESALFGTVLGGAADTAVQAIKTGGDIVDAAKDLPNKEGGFIKTGGLWDGVGENTAQTPGNVPEAEIPGSSPEKPDNSVSTSEIPNNSLAEETKKYGTEIEGIEKDIPLETAISSSRGTSFNPEKRGATRIEDYTNTLRQIYEEVAPLAKTSEEKQAFSSSFSKFRESYKQKTLALLNADSRTLSPMISGRGNFPVARNQKRLEQAMKLNNELLDMRDNAVRSLKRDVERAKTSDQISSERTKELEDLKAKQVTMKEANRLIKENDIAGLLKLGIPEKELKEITTPDFMGRLGYKSFQLTSINNKIKARSQLNEGISSKTEEALVKEPNKGYSGVNESKIPENQAGLTEDGTTTTEKGNIGRNNTYIPQKFVDIRGSKAETIEDVAAALKDYRNPREEIIHVVYTKEGKVAAHTAFSMDMVDAATIPPREVLSKINSRGARLGADGVYVSHNHPSGVVRPSREDKIFTDYFNKNVTGFKGHIILDHDKFAQISPEGVVTDHPIDLGKSYASSGQEITKREDAIELFKAHFPFEPGKVGILVLNPQLQPVTLKKVNYKENLQNTIKQTIRESRGSMAILGSDKNTFEQILNTVEGDPYIVDVIVRDSGRVEGIPLILLQKRIGGGFKKEVENLANKKPHRLFEDQQKYSYGDEELSIDLDAPEKKPEGPKKVGVVKMGDKEIEVTKGGKMELPIDEAGIRSRSADAETANKQYIKQNQKEAQEELPRDEILVIRKKENKIHDAYEAKKNDVEEALSNVLTQMDQATPGSRLITGTGADRTVTAIPSTYPKWLPENLRSRELFDRVLARVKDLESLRYPERISSSKEAKLIDEIYDFIDSETGINTTSLRSGITETYTPEVRAFAKDEAVLNKITEKSAKKTDEMRAADEKKKAQIEALREKQAELVKKASDEAEYRSSLNEKIAAAKREGRTKKNFFQRIKEVLKPIQYLDDKTKEITNDWLSRKIEIKELANQEYRKAYPNGEQTFQEIVEYQAGKKTRYIKEALDSMGTEFRRRGLYFEWLDDYIPQVWMDSEGQFQTIAKSYLKSQGLSDVEIEAYMAGEPLAKDKALRLKLKPNFMKERFFPDYVTGMEHGLRPKYQTPAQLIAYYREQGETSLNNRDFIDRLKSEAKLLTAEDAPDTWEPVSLRFSREGLHARPELAKLINGIFRDEDNLTLIPWLVKGASKVAKAMFDLKTISGVPFSTINSFAIGQANKLLTSAIGDVLTGNFTEARSNIRASFAFIRANSNEASKKWFLENDFYIAKMAEQGLSLGNYPGSYETASRSVADILSSAPHGAKFFGKGMNIIKNTGRRIAYFWSRWFNEKTMNSMMGQIQLQIFKDSYIHGMASGMESNEASQFAADVTKKFNGLAGNTGRAKGTEEGLSAALTAPYFRESVLSTLYNGFNSLARKHWTNTSYRRSRNFIVGMIIMYALYNALNKKLNDKWMWENAPGHEFQLAIPRKNGEILYVTYMPSFLAIVRNLGSTVINVGTGNFDVAAQKFGSLFSTPIQLTTEIWSNRDYFGRAIYKATDTGSERLKKIAKYAGLSVTHPFILESAKFINDDQPLYQALTRMMELPITYGSQDKEAMSAFYEALDQKKFEAAQETKRVMPVYEKNQELKAEGRGEEANEIYDALNDVDKKIYDNIKSSEKRKNTIKRKPIIQGIYEDNQKLIKQGRGEEANQIYYNLSDDDRRIYDSIKKAASN